MYCTPLPHTPWCLPAAFRIRACWCDGASDSTLRVEMGCAASKLTQEAEDYKLRKLQSVVADPGGVNLTLNPTATPQDGITLGSALVSTPEQQQGRPGERQLLPSPAALIHTSTHAY